MNKRKKAIFVIEMEWENRNPPMSAQIARDKLLTPMQELWIMRIIDKFSIEEVTKSEKVSKIMRGNEQGKRYSSYDKKTK